MLAGDWLAPYYRKLSLPDQNDQVAVEWGPYQIVQSTGARPYAKYMSNGKDKIYFAYTTVIRIMRILIFCTLII